MQLSAFSEKFTQLSDILQPMDDPGDVLRNDKSVSMFGGGNPVWIAEVSAVLTDVFFKPVAEYTIENIGNYSNPQGGATLVDALIASLNREYGRYPTVNNITLTNGSQDTLFYLFSLFGGRFNISDGPSVEKAILLPFASEYTGYVGVHAEEQHFVSVKPEIEVVTHGGETGFFKHRVGFDALENLSELKESKTGAIRYSRLTDLTGNVLTDGEMVWLDALVQEHGISSIIDNAYGVPLPSITYSDATLNWYENIILCFGLSKVSSPGVYTGIIVAAPEVVRAVSSPNATMNLLPTYFGATVTVPLL